MAGGAAFDISTPRGPAVASGGDAPSAAAQCGGEVSRHFIGTPTATGILSAFLDFDELDATGPPLDPDYTLVNTVGIACTPRDFEPCCHRSGDDSVSSGGSTRYDLGGSDSCADRSGSDGGSYCGEERGVFAFDDEADDGEEYEDDFEAESDVGSEDDGSDDESPAQNCAH